MNDHIADGVIVVVEDNQSNLRLLTSLLTARGYTVQSTDNGLEALEMMREQPPSLVLLDIDMPQIDGYDVCAIMKADEDLKDVPVIFISALDQVEDKVKAFKVGGVDYVTKPFRYEEVLARVDTQLTLYQQRRELERLREKDRRNFETLLHIKDEFVLKASHDLKSPLGAVTSALALLREQDIIEDPAVRDEYLDLVQSSVNRMMTLVTNLLDLMRVETAYNVTMEAVGLDAILQDAYERTLPLAHENKVNLILAPPERDIIITVDRDRIHLALHHLLVNAINFTPPDGNVELGAALPPDAVDITVTDTGLGIPDDAIAYLFERFYRVNTPHHLEVPGTGLGLAIVKAVAELHRGRVCAESTVQGGSKFTITLLVD